MNEASFASRFLRYPDLFPGRDSGEPWGSESLTLSFAGGFYLLEGLTAAQWSAVSDRFADDMVDGVPSGVSPVRVRIYRAAAEDFLPEPEQGGTYAFDTDHGERLLRLAGEAFMARIELEPALGGAVWIARETALISHGVLDNGLRLMEAYRLLAQGGVLLHCAGVVDQGRAILFLGRSGAGKSTVARASLATGRAVLSDDINALTRSGDSLLALKLPFAGDLDRTATEKSAYPVGALCLLKQGPVVEIVPASPGVALGALFTCAPFVNADPYRRQRLLGNLASLVEDLPVLSLTFNKGADFWTPLQAAIG